MDKMLKKFIAVLLVITLAGANLSTLGMYGISYALSDEGLEDGTTSETISEIGTTEGLLEAELTKYVTYATGGKYGVMLQTKVTSALKDNLLPLKETEINIIVPEINATKPTDVNVIALNTKATNGETDGTNFTASNYEYNAETGIVKITVQNSTDGSEWLTDVQDEYLVTFVFESQDIYNYVDTNGVDTKTTTSAKLKIYDDEETVVDVQAIETEIKPTEKIGTVADFDIEAVETVIGKGQVYSNYDEASVKKETSYFTRYIATTNNIDITDTIEFTQGIDKFLTGEDTETLTTVSGKNYTYNKIVRVSESVFNKILGEEGTITLYNASDKENTEKTPIGTITKETEIENGYYTLDISSEDNNQLYIVASKPLIEGQLVIDIEKAIKTEIDDLETGFANFSKIETNLEGKASTSTVKAMVQMLLKEPTSVAEIAISKTDLTTVIKNENVEIRAILDTSSLCNALYTNPTLKIKLPSYISEVDLKQHDIVMANGLTIKGTPEVTYESGSPVINIELEGTQQGYTLDAEYKGTIIVLYTDLTVETLTPSNSNKITMEFTNENGMSLNENGTVETELNFVAPTGVVAANGIDDILSISDENAIGEIPAYSESKVSTVYGKIVNNYANAIDSIVVLGRLPVQDNKNIETAESLGSTFSTTLKTNIAVAGIEEGKYTVYYSENVDATTDLLDTNNGWTTTATTTAKSYMIVTNEYEMAAGEMIEFSYDVEIPANLKHDNSVYEMYKVYYNNLSDIGEISESKTSSIIGLTTGKGPELTAELKSTVETVREGQIVKMKVTVKNTGSMVAENVKVNIPLPEKTTFIDYVTGNGFYENSDTTKVINVGTMNVGDIKQVSYYIKVDDDTTVYTPVADSENITEEEAETIQNASKFPKEIVNKVTITADELSGAINSNECILSVEDGKIAINMSCETNESQVLKVGDVLTYTINVTNISTGGDLNDVIVTIPLADGTKFKNAVIKDGWDDDNEITEGVSYNEETNTVQISIGTLEISKMIILDVEVEKFEGAITIIAKAQAEGTEVHYSNITEYMSEIVELEVSELTSTPRYVKEGETVTYTLTITNKGGATVYNIRVSDVLPEELVFVKATYMYAGQEQSVTTLKNGRVEIAINQMGAGDATTINIITKAGLLADENDKEIQNKITVTANSYEGATTNVVTNIIEYNEEIREQGGIVNPSTPSTPSNPSTPTEKRYKITGTAWLDENENGKRDTDEQLLSDITVILLNKEDNSIVKDPDTNSQKMTKTDSKGKYEFTNLPKGEYIVIFVYDASKYSLTTYQQKDIDSSLNSDAISINITLDGNRTIAGTTDAIKITDDNARDIDIGLYVSEKFDLKLDKYISKITLTTPTIGTKVYEKGNSKLEKVEVLEQNLGKSNIVIEYKIVVTNEGAVSGYVKKIVDYLPEGVGFNTELNKDWYLSDNGNVYNASLENQLIQPGESREVTLVVTKKVTEESLSTPLNNSAEIYESYNEQGLKDMDSTEGNKVQDEDDISEASIILSIVTGKVIMYTTIILGVAAILGFGIFEIKKRVLNRRDR